MTNLPLEVVESIDSTTAELLRRESRLVPPGTALLALSQRAGRGRSDRLFESPLGGMYLSVVVPPVHAEGLSLLGAKVAVDLVKGYGIEAQLRWPNDVMVKGRKLGGVLPVVRYAGNRLERAVLGVGLNIRPKLCEFSAALKPTTLALEDPDQEWAVIEVARRYLDLFWRRHEFLSAQGLPALVACCQDDLEGRGGGRIPVLIEPGRPSRHLAPIAGLDPDGALRLLDGTRLDSLGRQARLRFADELSPTSPH